MVLNLQDIDLPHFILDQHSGLIELGDVFTPLRISFGVAYWLLENVGIPSKRCFDFLQRNDGDWVVVTGDSMDLSMDHDVSIVLFIRDPKAAMLFKLTWIGK